MITSANKKFMLIFNAKFSSNQFKNLILNTNIKKNSKRRHSFNSNKKSNRLKSNELLTLGKSSCFSILFSAEALAYEPIECQSIKCWRFKKKIFFRRKLLNWKHDIVLFCNKDQKPYNFKMSLFPKLNLFTTETLSH